MTDEKTPRPKNPAYHVFEHGPGSKLWKHLTSEPVNAGSREAAIKAVAPGRPADDDTERSYLVIAAKEFQTFVHRTKTTKEDVIERGNVPAPVPSTPIDGGASGGAADATD
jgi:hypothetical protein